MFGICNYHGRFPLGSLRHITVVSLHITLPVVVFFFADYNLNVFSAGERSDIVENKVYKRVVFCYLKTYMIIVMFIETCLVNKFFLTIPTGEAFNLAQVIFTQRNWWHRRLFASVSCCWLLNVFSHFKATIMLLLFSRTLYRVFFFRSLATWKLAKAPFRMFAWILLQSCVSSFMTLAIS